jgi:hypothetical protein
MQLHEQKACAHIIFNSRQQTQQQTVQKAVENLVHLHAAGMVQPARMNSAS